MQPPTSGLGFSSTIFQSTKDPQTEEVMLKPVSLVPCRHTFDEKNVIKMITSEKICPLDKRAIEGYIPNHAVKVLVSSTHPQYPESEEPSEEARSFFLKGKELADKGNYDGAIPFLLEALRVCQNYFKAITCLDLCLQHRPSIVLPPHISSDLKENELSSKAAKEKLITLLLKLLDNPQIHRNKALNQILKTQFDVLMDQKATGLSNSQERLYNWAQKLIIQVNIQQYVATKIQKICEGPQLQPISSIPLSEEFMEAKKTAPHQAASQNDLSAIKVEKKAEVKAVDNNGWTPLHHAAYNGDVVKVFMDKEAEVRAKDKNGNTPLHLAALNGHIGVNDTTYS